MMKTTYKLAFLVVALLGITGTTNAQNAPGPTARAMVSAIIANPVSIIKETDMNFGDIVLQGTAGTVILSTEGTPIAQGVQLGAFGETPSAATFQVKGQPEFVYSISLPNNHTIANTREGGGEMHINQFVSEPTDKKRAGKLDSNGSQTIRVGATLHVQPNQHAGKYISTEEFEVKINYN